MITREDAQRYFWYFFGVLGVVLFWAGVWDGIGQISFLKNPFFSLVVGLILLSVGGIIRKTDNVNQQELLTHNVLKAVSYTHLTLPTILRV